jgi:Tol biopolymer transport system component
MKKLPLCIIIFYFFFIVAACITSEKEQQKVLTAPTQKMAGVRILTENGGHLAWSKKNNKIAFDRLGRDGYFDLWIMNPDGSGAKVLTANHPDLPNKHIGQPAWHPSGKLIVIQAQKAHVPRYADNKCTPGAGALNDLWIITPDGKRVWKIHSVRDEVSKNAAGVLHPHYLHKPFAVAADFDWSPDGSQIAGLVLTNRPDTRKRGSGINVLIDLPKN